MAQKAKTDDLMERMKQKKAALERKAAHREAEERRLADERRLAAAPPKPDVGSPPETKPAPTEPETKPKPPTWDFNTPQPKEPDAASDVLSRYRR